MILVDVNSYQICCWTLFFKSSMLKQLSLYKNVRCPKRSSNEALLSIIQVKLTSSFMKISFEINDSVINLPSLFD